MQGIEVPPDPAAKDSDECGCQGVTLIGNATLGPTSQGQFIVRAMLEWFGLDPDSDGLADTPRRVVDAWREMLSGYHTSPSELLRVQFDAHCDEMVTLRNIPFFSTCEHHLLPFSGRATVSYIPSSCGKVVGISKLARLVDCFAHRLQIQEKMTGQIAEAIQTNLSPRGVGVVVEAEHLCMACRGVMKPGTVLRTVSLLGAYRDASVRQEFLGGA